MNQLTVCFTRERVGFGLVFAKFIDHVISSYHRLWSQSLAEALKVFAVPLYLKVCVVKPLR
jgi:hypothetical protein